MRADTFLDFYSIKARLLPAVLVALPLLIGITGLFPAHDFTKGVLAGGVGALTLTAFLSQVARDQGRKKQEALWRSWGGSPSLRWLRHRTTRATPETLARYHRRLGARLGLRMPTSHDEEINPEGSDQIYSSCCEFLREFTRKKDDFPLVFAENVNYGYRRNLWAMKLPGVFITLLGLALCVVAGSVQWLKSEQVPALPLIGAAFNVLLLVWWWLRIKPCWVRDTAEEYAKQLLSACERLEEPVTTANIKEPKEQQCCE